MGRLLLLLMALISTLLLPAPSDTTAGEAETEPRLQYTRYLLGLGAHVQAARVALPLANNHQAHAVARIEAQILAGAAYERLGRTDRARQYYVSAASLLKGNPSPHQVVFVLKRIRSLQRHEKGHLNVRAGSVTGRIAVSGVMAKSAQVELKSLAQG